MDLIDQLDLEELLQIEDTEDEIMSKYRKKSKKFPSLKTNPTLWMFVQQVSREINGLTTKKINPYNSNLSNQQMKALRNLERNKKIVIKPPDKEGNIVLMDNIKYEQMCHNLIHNREWYKPILPLLEKQYYDEFYRIVDRAKNMGTITEEICKFL